MRIIPPGIHGILDYLTVILLVASPWLFSMDAVLSLIVYLTAGFQFLLSIFTVYQWGIIRLISFPVHGGIELVAGFLLLLLALFFRHAANMMGFYFYLSMAAIYLIVFLLTDYRSQPRKLARIDVLL